MHKVNQFAFYKFGVALRILDEVKPGNSFLDFSVPFLNIDRALGEFIDEISHIPLPLSKVAADTLRESINKTISAFIPSGETIDWERKITEAEVNKLISTRPEVETILAHESRDIDVYAVTPKGIYSTPALIERAEDALPAALKSRLSAETIYDIQQAGRCLAFNIPTAAGFHILKAIESLIREYHFKLTEKSLLSPLPSRWNADGTWNW